MLPRCVCELINTRSACMCVCAGFEVQKDVLLTAHRWSRRWKGKMAGLGPVSSSCIPSWTKLGVKQKALQNPAGCWLLFHFSQVQNRDKEKQRWFPVPLICFHPQTQNGLLQYKAIKTTFHTNPRISMGRSARRLSSEHTIVLTWETPFIAELRKNFTKLKM